MSSHLSPGEISNWLAGDRADERARHVGECALCAAEIARMEAALREFRGAAEQWSVPPVPARPAGRRVPLAAKWALAAAAAIVLAVAPAAYRHSRQQAAEAVRADALLFEQVDAEVSEAVPGPMEPLVQLVSWNSSEGNGETQ